MDRRLTYLLAERQPPAPSMLRLLLDRKAALEGEIAEHLRAARQAGTVADVRTLSALLRLTFSFSAASDCDAQICASDDLCKCLGSVAILAPTIARWLSLRCRLAKFRETTKASGSLPLYSVVLGSTPASLQARQRGQTTAIRTET